MFLSASRFLTQVVPVPTVLLPSPHLCVYTRVYVVIFHVRMCKGQKLMLSIDLNHLPP